MKKSFYCPTCKRYVTDVYLDSLTGITASQFSKKCSVCNTPVLELSDREVRFEEPSIEKPEETNIKQNNKQKGMYYGIISIIVALAGFITPIPINAIFGMIAIVIGRQAIILGFPRIGKIGVALGFIHFVFLLLKAINLIA
jgi:hypothetical protein